MYKLVAIDLDGTMLNHYGEISEKTKETVTKCIEKGIEIVLASGRPIDSIRTIAKSLGIQGYFVAGNGALIYDIKNDEMIYKKRKSIRHYPNM